MSNSIFVIAEVKALQESYEDANDVEVEPGWFDTREEAEAFLDERDAEKQAAALKSWRKHTLQPWRKKKAARDLIERQNLVLKAAGVPQIRPEFLPPEPRFNWFDGDEYVVIELVRHG